MATVRLVRTASLAVLIAVASVSRAAEQPLTTVADLRYGVALYDYYQDKHLQALSELLVAEERGGIQGHGDNPEIMTGGFYLAYGMERTASDIFKRLLAENRPRETQDAAWFYLARLRYLRGDWDDCERALAHVSGSPPAYLAEAVAALRVNLAISQGQLAQAKVLMTAKALHQSDNLPFLHYNLGAAYSRTGDYQSGVQAFSELEYMQERSSEHLALYDKSMTAAGFAYLFNQDYQSALREFTKVRLHSPMSSRALLGYGWAAIELGEYREALMPWQELIKRPLIDENTQEALVAIPYTYEKMGHPAFALNSFRAAEAGFSEEIARMDAVMTGLQGHAIRDALNVDRSTDIHWLTYASQNNLSPELSYLVALFAQEAFQGLVQELRDLLAIQENIHSWQEKLTLYSDMLDQREVNRSQELDFLAQQRLDESIQRIQVQRDELAATVAQLEQQPDLLALVAVEDATKLERLNRAEHNLAVLQNANRRNGTQVMPPEDLANLAETVRLQRGLMTWQAAEMYDERLWRVGVELSELDRQLEELRASRTRVQAIVDQGFDLMPYRAQIYTAKEDLLNQTVDVEYAIEQTQDRLRSQVMIVLEGQRARLDRHLGQARLSIARLLDSASDDGAAETAEDE